VSIRALQMALVVRAVVEDFGTPNESGAPKGTQWAIKIDGHGLQPRRYDNHLCAKRAADGWMRDGWPSARVKVVQLPPASTKSVLVAAAKFHSDLTPASTKMWHERRECIPAFSVYCWGGNKIEVRLRRDYVYVEVTDYNTDNCYSVAMTVDTVTDLRDRLTRWLEAKPV